MRLTIVIPGVAISAGLGQTPKSVLDLVGVDRGSWTMYGLDQNGTSVKRFSWTDVITASMPTVADGKAFVTTVDEITFDNPRIPPNHVKGREGWFLAPDGKTFQDYFIETNGQVEQNGTERVGEHRASATSRTRPTRNQRWSLGAAHNNQSCDRGGWSRNPPHYSYLYGELERRHSQKALGSVR
jgi:hypothetical protein